MGKIAITTKEAKQEKQQTFRLSRSYFWFCYKATTFRSSRPRGDYCSVTGKELEAMDV
jgi:hypothetical protein